jgi:hypothetical protein
MKIIVTLVEDSFASFLELTNKSGDILLNKIEH